MLKWNSTSQPPRPASASNAINSTLKAFGVNRVTFTPVTTAALRLSIQL